MRYLCLVLLAVTLVGCSPFIYVVEPTAQPSSTPTDASAQIPTGAMKVDAIDAVWVACTKAYAGELRRTNTLADNAQATLVEGLGEFGLVTNCARTTCQMYLAVPADIPEAIPAAVLVFSLCRLENPTELAQFLYLDLDVDTGETCTRYGVTIPGTTSGVGAALKAATVSPCP